MMSKFLKKVKERYQKSTGDYRVCIPAMDIIIFLEKEIDRYRDKIAYLEGSNESLHERLVNIQGDLNATLDRTVTLEAVQENTVGEIIKALSDNGFNNISINAYKTKEE